MKGTLALANTNITCVLFADALRCSVMRDGAIARVNPCDLVVGDIVVLQVRLFGSYYFILLCYQAGDAIPADCVIVDESEVYSNESALTGILSQQYFRLPYCCSFNSSIPLLMLSGEPEDLSKSVRKDPFLLSSCLLTEAQDKVLALVIGITLLQY